MIPGADSPWLRVRDLALSFGGQRVVDGVSLSFEPGALTAIVGPNGAGKTTFFNLLSGQLRPQAGRIQLGSADLTRLDVSHRARLGVGRVFQIHQLFASLSVLQNVALAVSARRISGRALWRRADRQRAVLDQARQCLAQVQLRDQADLPVPALSHAGRRKLELAMLLAQDPVVWLLDEPTAGMGVEDVPVILDLLDGLRRCPDRILLLIEHKMDVVQSLADRIIVLHQGKVLADGSPDQVMASALVQDVYLGGSSAWA